jgi:hypothetical protein
MIQDTVEKLATGSHEGDTTSCLLDSRGFSHNSNTIRFLRDRRRHVATYIAKVTILTPSEWVVSIAHAAIAQVLSSSML